MPPEIILDSDTGIYTVKEGREIVIAPNYESAEGATYSWTMNGEVLSTSPSLSFVGEEIGEYFIVVSVTTEGGTDSEEIRVDVIALEVPMVSIAGNKKQTVAIGTEVKLNATVRETTLQTSVVWSINGPPSATEEELSYIFKAETVGSYTITATATNEDGKHSDSVQIEVVNAEDMPFVWEFDRTSYHTVVGRKLQIKPSSVSNGEGVVYTWQIDDCD